MREFTSAEAELRYRQRSLIPLNIFVALLCAVAALSILFMPLMQIDVDSLSYLLTQQQEDSTEEGSLSVADVLTDAGLTVSLNGMDFIRLGTEEDPITQLVGKVGDSFSAQAETLAAKTVVIAAAESTGMEIKTETVEKVNNALTGLEEASTDEEVDSAISSILDSIKEDFPVEQTQAWDDEQIRSTVRDMYDKTVAQNEGEFSAEAFICVNASEALNESGSGTGEVYTNFSDMMTGMSGTVVNTDEISSQIPDVVFLIAAGAIGFFALVWAILFLFAFFHMFARNKRFMMWYVKLFGFLPCLIFGVAPLLAGKFIQDATLAAALGAVSTFAWISGACYILLWLVSILWAFPIKHRIRKLKREL